MPERIWTGLTAGKEKFALGDVNTSLIRTKNGKTINPDYDTNLPRPYTRIQSDSGEPEDFAEVA
jgi:hypothetical protein